MHRLADLRTVLSVLQAIFALDHLPKKWQSYIEKNANYVEGGKLPADKSLAINRRASAGRCTTLGAI